jgi:two-component system OmpR family sensor kinase
LISLRRNLLVFLLGAVLLAVVAGAIATYRLALAEADEIFDYHLRQLALSLRDQAFARAPSPELPDDDFDFVVQVSDAGGVRLYLSHPHKVLPLNVQLGFSTIETAEGRWRVFSQIVRGQLVEVAQPMAVRSRMALGAALKSVWPFVVILPVLGLALWWGIGRGLAPLDRLARGVAARSPGALDPLPMSGVPVEVQPLVQSVNDLLERLRLALDAQRAFVADAAHELRTPIAALKLQAQLLARTPDEAGRQAAAADLEAGVTRTARVVQQLLTLARVEPGAAEEPFGSVDLEELARSVVTDHAQVAIARGLDLGIEETRSVEIRGQKDALRTLLANLLENAIRYTPAGGRINVRTGVTGDRAWIEVADTGPGIPMEERARVFDRFYRGAGTGETGSGLGLAIVKAIADRNRAEVRLDDTPGGGLTVRVSFSIARA